MLNFPKSDAEFINRKSSLQLGRNAIAAALFQAIPSCFFKKLSESSLFITKDKLESLSGTCDYCVAALESIFYSLDHCQHHILLTADKDKNDLFMKLDRFRFKFQRVDCFYTLFKYKLSGNILMNFGDFFDTVERAVSFNRLNTGVEKKLSIAKERLLRQKFKKHMLTSIHKSTSVQTSGSGFVERVERIRRTTKFELELLKINGGFFDGYGSY